MIEVEARASVSRELRNWRGVGRLKVQPTLSATIPARRPWWAIDGLTTGECALVYAYSAVAGVVLGLAVALA